MENDYEIGEADGYICKNCESTYTKKSIHSMTEGGETDPACEYCGKGEILPMTVKQKEKVIDLKPRQKFRIIYTATERHDEYYEDDYGVENHTLSGVTKIRYIDVYHKTSAVLEVAKEIERIGEANADNPPYDSYSVKMVYDVLTNQYYPLRYFEVELEFNKHYEDEVISK